MYIDIWDVPLKLSASPYCDFRSSRVKRSGYCGTLCNGRLLFTSIGSPGFVYQPTCTAQTSRLPPSINSINGKYFMWLGLHLPLFYWLVTSGRLHSLPRDHCKLSWRPPTLSSRLLRHSLVPNPQMTWRKIMKYHHESRPCPPVYSNRQVCSRTRHGYNVDVLISFLLFILSFFFLSIFSPLSVLFLIPSFSVFIVSFFFYSLFVLFSFFIPCLFYSFFFPLIKSFIFSYFSLLLFVFFILLLILSCFFSFFLYFLLSVILSSFP